MTVVKEAFHEGRETSVDWDDSKAKRDEVKLSTFSANVDNFNGRTYGAPIALEQVCPDTGKVLQTFSSRFAAAKWIVVNVLKLDDPSGKKALSITGNMHMCITAGWKSYGYYWRTINAEKHHERLVKVSGKVGHGALHVLDVRNHVVKTLTFASMHEARGSLGVSDSTIKKTLALKTPVYKGLVFTRYNLTPKVKKFKDIESAAKFFHAPAYYISKMIAAGTPINNYTIEVPQAPKTEVVVIRDRKVVGTFPTVKAAAESLGVTRHVVSKAISFNRKIGIDRVVKRVV